MNPTQPSPATFHPGRHFQVLDDPMHDPYQARAKLQDPSVCDSCGAVYHQGRWQWGTPVANALHATCPACRRMQEHAPAGYVTIEGPFACSNRAELLNLVRHLEDREKSEHPLQRVMAIEEQQDDKLLITTTDIHLARDIGEALENAYKGELDFHYNKDEYLLRVHWRR